jgi:hypothetical protein
MSNLIYKIYITQTGDKMFEESNRIIEEEIFTWKKLFRAAKYLYIIALIGYTVKALNQGLISNVWQILGLLVLPLFPYVAFAIPFLVFYAIKKFDISRCAKFCEILAYTYIVITVFKIFSSKPL